MNINISEILRLYREGPDSFTVSPVEVKKKPGGKSKLQNFAILINQKKFEGYSFEYIADLLANLPPIKTKSGLKEQAVKCNATTIQRFYKKTLEL